jgi:hypothetical protein
MRMTYDERRSYDRLLGETSATIQQGRFLMAGVPPTKPLLSDDSWGLLLIPILFCVALLVSAVLWL